ncbi:substrate-binding periplasmic protein [Oceanospirillum sanctuarii]|uniref:substrate-binding periplasmic protein n=1 Tax=Oceanospirillum sanctuarii TaxID=1434821 RepID=UPI000A39AFC6|nr:transporter substrate-binding domain-containing protein [Oceanospirillum sanctuarii]
MGFRFLNRLACAAISLAISTAVTADAHDPVVFSTSSVEPWGYFIDGNQPAGLLVEFNEALQAELKQHSSFDVTFENYIRPYPRVINDIKTGRADFAVLFNSPESHNYGDSVGEVSTFDVVVTGRQDSAGITSLDDLEGLPVGHVRGSKYGPAFDDNTKILKVSLDSMEKGLDMLLKGRLAALICLDQTLYHSMNEKGIAPDQTKTLFVIGKARADLFISKRSKKRFYMEEVEDALDLLHEKGTIKAIFDLNRPH